MSVCISLGTVAIGLHADDAELRSPMDALFAGCTPCDAHPEITVRGQRAPVEVPDRDPDVADLELRAWLDREGVTIQHRSGASARRVDDEVSVGGYCDSTDPTRAFRVTSQLPLIDALRVHGHHVIHAATVELHGRALVVLGDSGAGKSTFCYAAAVHGWRVLADDLTVVAAASRPDAPATVAVTGFPKPLHVPLDAIGAPPPGARPMPDDARARWRLPTSWSSGSSTQFGVAALVLLEHSPGGSTSRIVEPGPTTLRVVLQAYPAIAVAGSIREFLPVAGELTRQPIFAYGHAREAGERVAAVGEFLESLSTAEPTTVQ